MIQKFVGLILGLTIVWGCFSAYGQTAIETDSLLREAKVRDQTIREQLAQLTRRASEQGLTSLNASLADSLVSLSEQMQAIDRENLKLVSISLPVKLIFFVNYLFSTCKEKWYVFRNEM